MSRQFTIGAIIGGVLSALLVIIIYEVGRETPGGENNQDVSASSIRGSHDTVGGANSGNESRSEGGHASGSLVGKSGTSAELMRRLAELQAEKAQREAEIVALSEELDEREELEELEEQREEVKAAGERDAGSIREKIREANWFPPSQEDLEELVDQCAVRSDEPPVMGETPGTVGRYGDDLGLTDEERTALDDAIGELHRSFSDQLRAVYIEATGDDARAKNLTPEQMYTELRSLASREEVQNAQKTIAEERAGQREPPGSLENASAFEKAIRLRSGLGDGFEHRLGETLGADRANELRAASGGWPWGRHYSKACN